MATGTFTYNTLHTKHKRNTKENCKSLKLYISNAVSAGVTAIKQHLSICLVGLVWFPRCCGKMDSRRASFFLWWIGYPPDWHINYVRFNGLILNVFYGFKNSRKACQSLSLQKVLKRHFSLPNLL